MYNPFNEKAQLMIKNKLKILPFVRFCWNPWKKNEVVL